MTTTKNKKPLETTAKIRKSTSKNNKKNKFKLKSLNKSMNSFTKLKNLKIIMISHNHSSLTWRRSKIALELKMTNLTTILSPLELKASITTMMIYTALSEHFYIRKEKQFAFAQ